MGADWLLFWEQHYSRPLLVDALNAISIKWVWEHWVQWFGLVPDPDPIDQEIQAMRDKAAKLRRSSRKKRYRQK